MSTTSGSFVATPFRPATEHKCESISIIGNRSPLQRSVSEPNHR
jgi:hypothetical protein